MRRFSFDVEWTMKSKILIDALNDEEAQEILFDMDLPEGDFDSESLQIIDCEEVYDDVY